MLPIKCMKTILKVKCETTGLSAKAWLKLGMQQANNTKHQRKFTGWFKKKTIIVLQWPKVHNLIST